jgi:hypothetical protein
MPAGIAANYTAGVVDALSAGLQWAVLELTQLQQQQHGTAWHCSVCHLGVGLLRTCAVIFGIVPIAAPLTESAGFTHSVLPVGQLAWLLLQAEQQAVDGGSSSSSTGTGTGRGKAASSKRQQRQHQTGGLSGSVMEFLHSYGGVVMQGVDNARVTGGHMSVTDQWCFSDEVTELLLAYAALTVGAKHKLLCPATAASKAKSSSSSSSSSSSKRRDKTSKTATPQAAAAGGVPANHVTLLTAVSPVLEEQTHRQYPQQPSASGFGSFSSCGDNLLHRDMEAALGGLLAVLERREELLTQLQQGSRAATNAAAAATMPGSSSSSSSSSQVGVTAAGRVVRSAVPRELQLLLPLLLTVIEAMQLLPRHSHAQGIMPSGLLLAITIMKAAKLVPNPSPDAVFDMSATWTTAAVFADSLAGPVLLQLGPAVMQYLREVEAAAAAAAAAAAGKAGAGSSSSRVGSSSGGGAVDASQGSRQMWHYTDMLTVVLKTGVQLEGTFTCACFLNQMCAA